MSFDRKASVGGEVRNREPSDHLMRGAPAPYRSAPEETNAVTHQGSSPKREAGEPLFGQAYDELRALAGAYLNRERRDHSLQATELVNEAYLRLEGGSGPDWVDRTHFFAVAARAMRRILVDYARTRGRKKRFGGLQRVTLAEGIHGRSELELDAVLDLDRAISRLAELDNRQARVVELRYFSGLGVAEVAEVLGVSKRTVEGDWAHARAWLRRELSGRDRDQA
jgi:RNA polymerase sigma-70 factor (ECF subfamily)